MALGGGTYLRYPLLTAMALSAGRGEGGSIQPTPSGVGVGAGPMPGLSMPGGLSPSLLRLLLLMLRGGRADQLTAGDGAAPLGAPMQPTLGPGPSPEDTDLLAAHLAGLVSGTDFVRARRTRDEARERAAWEENQRASEWWTGLGPDRLTEERRLTSEPRIHVSPGPPPGWVPGPGEGWI